MSIMFLSCGTKFCVSQFFAYFGTLFYVLFQIFMRFVYNQPQKCVKKSRRTNAVQRLLLLSQSGAEGFPDGGFPSAGDGNACPAAHPYLAGGKQLHCFQIDHIGAVRLYKAAICQ